MRFSAKPLLHLSLFIGALCTVSLFSSCGDDDDGTGGPLTYDATKHIYATSSQPFSPGGKWEMIIDPQSGAYHRIAGTESAGGVSFPSGTKYLTDFAGNRRIYWNDAGKHLVVQDLETFENTILEIEDTVAGATVINPQFFTFGATNEVIYVFDGTRDLWRVDLDNGTSEVVFSNLSFDDHIIDNQLYVEATNQLIYGGHTGTSNVYVSTAIFTLDLATGEIANRGDVPASFGWVQHPEDGSIFGLTNPTDDQGFRLMRLRLSELSLETQMLSPGNLDIDNMSFHAQTIHTATATYICRGGSSMEGMLENYIYSIDLAGGELSRTISIHDDQLILSLNGE